jgi:hypothetical protein
VHGDPLTCILATYVSGILAVAADFASDGNGVCHIYRSSRARGIAAAAAVLQ